MQCDSQNQLNISMMLPLNLGTQTYLYMTLPTVYYSFVNQDGYVIESQNASYIKVKKLISECTSFMSNYGLCAKID